ncbi:hypothetical protein LTV02_20410 [Nocardia yamanashiensis]|uniref:hypothetical protein n=1 Tax=Nocardia yamanashiensis TaxID=209247 RepID=UPI00082D67B2|nr:hypothetical protein [Nocardia yamanashiensis]UGT38520.1 hypothetical protein LTV02_20410 [Nocardia yamanashiensis]
MAEQNSGVPGTVRGAGALVALEGTVGLIVAIVLLVRAIGGADQHVVNGYGTAAYLAILSGAVLAAGIGLWLGKRWPRAIGVLANLLLVPVAWYMLTSSQPLFGVPLGLVAIASLVLLFAPASSRWMAAGYGDAE